MAYVAKCSNSPPTPITVPNPLSFSPMSSSSTATNFASPPTSQPSSPPPPAVVLSPCAACKILRRRCVEKCVLAPYFPPTEPLKFTIAHRVFGASNIIKFLQVCPLFIYSFHFSTFSYYKFSILLLHFFIIYLFIFYFLLCSLVRISTKKFPNYTMSNQSYVLILEVIMAINFFGISECKKNK